MTKATLALLVVLVGCASPEPRWYRGNLHTHSLWSDGNDFPEMIVDWYASRGYHFLALTDHNILSDHEKWVDNDLVIRRGGRTGLARYRDRFGGDWVETRRGDDGKLEVRLKTLDEFRELFEREGEFLLIQAEEISASFEKKPIHINASNLAELVLPESGTSVRDVIRNNLAAVREQAERLDRPILAHLNHPNYGWAITAEDLAAVVEEEFFEVYNGHPSVHHLGDAEHPSVERMWDIANTLRLTELDGPLLYGLATDDSHNYFNATGSTPGRGWVMVRARELTPEALIEAIEDGAFYASSGVTLGVVRFDGRVVALEIEADGDATFTTEFVGTRVGSTEVGEVLARAEGRSPRYRLRGDELYVRAVVTASVPPDNPVYEGQRKQAWTQPVRPGASTAGD